MKARCCLFALLTGVLSLFLASTAVHAVDYPKQPITIKVPGSTMMAPVTFSHESHEKQKIACATCHHKDAQNPKACTTCHTAKGGGGGAPAAKDAFHNRCIECHKQAAAKKGLKAPTACNDCHKK